ncbi:thiol-disulfide oxidoreductase DCC family protein [Luedemannella flava]|uniref:thiol-disulfide oxidoreductase DCC family protein n=1 Tax=Luedemannella flava TaxID=349316 RepID=UPI0031DD82C8
MSTPAQAVFLYDGDCAFCSSCARFLTRRVPTPATVAAWQRVDIAALGVTGAECDTAVQWITADATGRPTHVSGPAAIAALLRSSTPAWRVLGRLLAVRPVLAAAGPVYRLVARNRDRMPGGTAACALPQAERAATDTTRPPTLSNASAITGIGLKRP